MARIYSDEEKRLHLDQYKVSGKTKTEYARVNDIPEATFRAWIKEENLASYGMLDIGNNDPVTTVKITKPIIFANENIRIELREGFDKRFLKRIIEVLIDDTKVIE